MRKTSNGHTTLTLQEFREDINDIVELNDHDSELAYNEIIGHGLVIKSVREITDLKAKVWYLAKYVKEQYRSLYKVLDIACGYDNPIGSFVPQDNPFDILLVNVKEHNGNLISHIYEQLHDKEKYAQA